MQFSLPSCPTLMLMASMVFIVIRSGLIWARSKKGRLFQTEKVPSMIISLGKFGLFF